MDARSQTPKWNANDPTISFLRFYEDFKKTAQSTFLSDKFHAEMFFVFMPDGRMGIMQNKDMERNAFARKLKDFIQKQGVYGVIHISEGWTYFAKGKDDHTMTQIEYGEIKVSELKDGDRKETLFVHMQSRDGADSMWLMQIIRNQKTGEVYLGEGVEWKDLEGRFGNLFK